MRIATLLRWKIGSELIFRAQSDGVGGKPLEPVPGGSRDRRGVQHGRRCRALRELAAMCRRHDAWLMVDDAHGFGVLGASGRGSLEAAGLTASDVPVLMCTLGKAFGVFGAFVAGSETLIETLIQRGRSYIYTTAPPRAARRRAALAVQAEEAGDASACLPRRALPGSRDCARLRALGVRHADTADRYRNETAARREQALLAEGLWVPAIRRRPCRPDVRDCVSRSRPRTRMPTSTGCSRRRDPLPARSALMSTAGQADPRRPALVLLHGFALHSGCGATGPPGSQPVEPRAIDLPGHGTRPWDPRITDLAGLAARLRAVPGTIVLGWSLGGMIALELARQRPTTIGGLVLVATTPRFVSTPDWPHGIEPEVLETFAQNVRDYHRAVQDFLALGAGRRDPRVTLRELRAAARSRPAPDPEGLETCLDILRRADLRGVLGDIALATLVITGQHDRLTHPAAGEFLASSLPRGRWLRIAGAGHAPFLSHPAALRDEVVAFLDRQRPPSARPAVAAG